jgi:Zn-dependent protease with chaperone function
MLKPLQSALLLLIATAGLLPLRAYARPIAQQQDQKNAKDQKSKKDQKPDKAAVTQAKEEREYIKMKQFAQTEMEKDFAFKSQIESAYRRKQREHSEYAFYINTFDAQDEQVTRTGDKLKIEDTLYDNPLVQDYINRLGHSLVPKSSQNLYAFKVILNPIPEARSLSTGTVYVSTGLLSLVDNEAQLAYVLSHEIAHVEKNHWYEDVVVGEGVARFNQKQEQKRSLFGGIATLAVGPLMRAFGANPANALMATLYVENGLPTVLKLAMGARNESR